MPRQLKYITLARLLSWRPCEEWTLTDILVATGGRRRMTPLEVADLPGVSADDKLWVLLRTEVLPDNKLRLFACWCADRALCAEAKAGRPPDKRSKAAVRVARAFARGEATAEQLEAARLAAGLAVGLTARSVARSTAGSAAWLAAEAARSAAGAGRDGAGTVAWSTARSAARSAAWLEAEAEAVQLRHLKRVLKRLAEE